MLSSDLFHEAMVSAASHPQVQGLFADPPPDMTKTFEELCIENGYQTESYFVTTEDGYILEMFRIPGKIEEEVTQEKQKEVLFFQHGILTSADCFVMNTKDKSPAFRAVEEGYDVWLGNIRGNMHSRSHISLDPNKDGSFWDFSFPEHGLYDVTAMINHVKEVTNVDKVAYIGHSMGTTIMYYLAAKNPTFVEENISIAIQLGSVLKPIHIKSGFLYELIKG